MPRDYARFYLCLTSPEHNRNNFSRDELTEILNDRLITSWNTLINTYYKQEWSERHDVEDSNVESTIRIMHERLALTCNIETYSQSRLADWIIHHIGRLRELISSDSTVSLISINRQLHALLNGVGLVLIDLKRTFDQTNRHNGFGKLMLT